MSINSDRKYKRYVKAMLWRLQKGICCYCGKPMMHSDDLMSDPVKVKKYGVKFKNDKEFIIKRIPDNLATIEHLIDRFHPDRRKQAYGEKRYALACAKCNNMKGKQRDLELPLEERQKRSRRR